MATNQAFAVTDTSPEEYKGYCRALGLKVLDMDSKRLFFQQVLADEVVRGPDGSVIILRRRDVE